MAPDPRRGERLQGLCAFIAQPAQISLRHRALPVAALDHPRAHLREHQRVELAVQISNADLLVAHACVIPAKVLHNPPRPAFVHRRYKRLVDPDPRLLQRVESSRLPA